MELALELPINLVIRYKSASQKARVLTETWAASKLRCPSCNGRLALCPPNMPGYDLECSSCRERFQLKSKAGIQGNKILGAEYSKTLTSITSGNRPSLLLLEYETMSMAVVNVQVIHRACITESCIVPRKPLSQGARRAGWQGCYIHLDKIPASGRIDILVNQVIQEQTQINLKWQQANKLLEREPVSRGWTADVLRIIEGQPDVFALRDIYSHEEELSRLHTDNHRIKPKIRQQLQVLRDLGFIHFMGHGHYSRKL